MATLTFGRDGCEMYRGLVVAEEAARLAELVLQMDLASMGSERVSRGDRFKHRYVANFNHLAGDTVFAGLDLAKATGWSGIRRNAVHAYRVPAGSQGEAACWHQDTVVLHQPHVLTLIAYLTDVPDAESGATWVVPGSRGDTTRGEMRERPRCPILAGAGDVLLMDGALWHRGAAVDASKPARTVVSAFYSGTPPPV